MYDAVIIGAGVTGCVIARELSRYDARICVLERGEDVCCGTSKANSAIVHAGFDAEPGTLKARMNVRGNELMEGLCRELDVPFKRNGSLVIATSRDGGAGEDPALRLEKLKERGETNGVPGLRILDRDEVLAMEPAVTDDVTAALSAPTGAIVCPFGLTIALAENACENGALFRFDTEVIDIRPEDGGFVITTSAGDVKTRAVINAAGVYADIIHNMVSRDTISIVPRKGEYCLFDHAVGGLVSHTIFRLPGSMGKGVLVTPTVHGNLLIGPTAADASGKESLGTTACGLDAVLAKAGEILKEVPRRQVITSFAGLRAHEAGGDFILGEAKDAPGFFDAAGIESPGLSAAPAVGEYLAGLVSARLDLKKKTDFKAARKAIPQVHTLPPGERAALISERPDYAQIVCRCEMISEGEIIDAIRRNPGARSLDGVKRRTRAGMGRCQAGFCSPRVMEIICRETKLKPEQITKSGGASFILARGGMAGTASEEVNS